MAQPEGACRSTHSYWPASARRYRSRDRAGTRRTAELTAQMDESQELVAELGGLLLGEQCSHKRGAQLAAALGVAGSPSALGSHCSDRRGGSPDPRPDLA